MAKFKIDIEVGDDHYMRFQSTVPDGTEVVYLTGSAYGAVEGAKNASSFLTDLLPDDLSGLSEELKIQAAAGKAAK